MKLYMLKTWKDAVVFVGCLACNSLHLVVSIV